MTLNARLSRIEQKHRPGDPLTGLTDEELDAAIDHVSACVDGRPPTADTLSPAMLKVLSSVAAQEARSP
ncbi:hypothetical protein ABMA32_22350 [Mesorhizobium sp. VNQ89]|uniref:hypothetical protein n=1 Tax=Mesorhizobium quangtriensis TaxID=3157709 RepID=UPI0032B74090